MLAEPDRTPYDLNFRFLGFPVRVHPWFWLFTVMLGANLLDLGLIYLVMWVGVVFVSILVHELGHALAFRRFGANSHIVLWMFGGLAIGSPVSRYRWERIAVSLAGPAAGFVLCALVYASHQSTDWGSPRNGFQGFFLYRQLIFVNLVWGIVNLLPVYPLDGGQVSRELCEGKSPARGLVRSLQISVGTAATIAIYSLACEAERRSHNEFLEFLPDWFPRGSLYTAIMFGLLAYQSYQLLQIHGRGYYYEAPDDRTPWEK